MCKRLGPVRVRRSKYSVVVVVVVVAAAAVVAAVVVIVVVVVVHKRERGVERLHRALYHSCPEIDITTQKRQYL